MGRSQKHKSHRSSQNSFRIKRIKIDVENHQTDLPIKKALVRNIVQELCSILSLTCEKISIYFVAKRTMGELHTQFFQDPSPTDCMSFPLNATHLGEVVICPAVALAYAKSKKMDPYREILLYLIHGILHLVGYDDLTPSDRKAMRKKEKHCMDHFIERGMALGPIVS